MSQRLVTENMQLRSQLAELLAHAQQNQQILQRYQAFDLQFIAANGFRELIDAILHGFAKNAELDVVTLVLIDPDAAIRRILSDLHIDLTEFPHLLFVPDQAALPVRSGSRPALGPHVRQLHGRIFPEPATTPASVAVMPLMRRGCMIGCLNLGSRDSKRFTPDMRTDFIEHLAAIVAVCVENVVNNEKLKHIGLTDPLTGVNNRRYVELRLIEEAGRSRRHAHPLSCMYIDIDHFKQINDRFGHQGGDEVLCEVAARIKAELRLSDTLGRFGGEEFVALLIDTALADAVSVAERIRESVARQPLSLSNGETLEVTVSIGVASLLQADRLEPVAAMTQKLVARADQALYQAKNGGRNRVATPD